MAATDLYAVADALLQAAKDAVATTPGGAIDVAYVAESLPAFDCIPQLTVHAAGVVQAETNPTSPSLQPGHRPVVGQVNLIVLTITVIRCAAVPTFAGQPPPASAHTVPAQETMADVWAIWNHLVTLKLNGGLGGYCKELFLDPSISPVASGGAAGWEINVRVQLDGYRTANGA